MLVKKLPTDHFIISKKDAQQYGIEYAIIAGLLIQYHQQYNKEFILTVKDISKETNISEGKVRSVLKTLETQKAISRVLRGVPAKPFIKVL